MISRRFTPPTYAKALGVSPEKVRFWIESGELRAINVATTPRGRPRYVITEEDAADFERRRAVAPRPAPGQRTRVSSDLVEYV